MTTIEQLREQINDLKRDVNRLDIRVRELEQDKLNQLAKKQPLPPATGFKTGKA